MKHVLLLLMVITSVSSYGQESFKKKYQIPGHIVMAGRDTVFLMKDSLYAFNDLPDSLQNIIKREYQSNETVTVTKEIVIGGEKTTVQHSVSVDDEFYKSLSQSISRKVKLRKAIDGFVKFEEDKIIVNPHLIRKGDEYSRRELYYFKLKNRQTIRLPFTEFTVSTLIIPLKYRFRRGDIPEDFSTAFNANFFLGPSVGETSFFHRDKVDNKSNTWKATLGVLLGAAVTELNASNTKHAAEPLTDDVKYNKGLASFGFGGTYSLNKINFGLFYGWDFAVGSSSEKWDYNKRPWCGLAVGYSLFN